MGAENKYSWIKEGVFKKLKANRECVIEAVDGVGTSVVVSMYAVDDAPLSITMNGEEVLAEVVMFTFDRSELNDGEVIVSY